MSFTPLQTSGIVATFVRREAQAVPSLSLRQVLYKIVRNSCSDEPRYK
ncbi:hypothetical protein [Scytonema hofmannii]|nr:hypothetical protein [Scytonema hofmannii]